MPAATETSDCWSVRSVCLHSEGVSQCSLAVQFISPRHSTTVRDGPGVWLSSHETCCKVWHPILAVGIWRVIWIVVGELLLFAVRTTTSRLTCWLTACLSRGIVAVGVVERSVTLWTSVHCWLLKSKCLLRVFRRLTTAGILSAKS